MREYSRGMTPSADGLPRIDASARELGIREGEVRVDASGMALPGTGGMSAAPDSPWHLPHHRRPSSFGRGSTGPDGDRVYSCREVVLDRGSLVARADPRAPLVHAFIEARSPVRLAEYVAALEGTRPAWEVVQP